MTPVLPNLMRAGAELLATTAKAVDGQTAVYQRFAGTGVASAYRGPLTVWPLRRQEFATNPGGQLGATLASTDQDFGCAVADFPAKLVQPAEGDRIEVAVNGETHTYELKGGGGQPAWSFDDTNGVSYRLRGKLKKERKAPTP